MTQSKVRDCRPTRKQGPECIAAFDMEIFRTVGEKVHAGNGGSGQFFSCPLELASKGSRFRPVL